MASKLLPPTTPTTTSTTPTVLGPDGFAAGKNKKSPTLLPHMKISQALIKLVHVLTLSVLIFSSMMATLEFDLGRPLPLNFLRRHSKAASVDGTFHNVAKFAMELTITDYKMAHVAPSALAGEIWGQFGVFLLSVPSHPSPPLGLICLSQYKY